MIGLSTTAHSVAAFVLAELLDLSVLIFVLDLFVELVGVLVTFGAAALLVPRIQNAEKPTATANPNINMVCFFILK